jgi:hypothetical protein
MATFAIVRQDGEVDLADGVSVQDVSDRYGWPGNGSIAAYTPALHDKGLRHTFTSPDNQRELLTADATKSDGGE